MAVGSTLVTPKVVFPTFAKPFAFAWSWESDCLATRVSNRGFGMIERGSKVGLTAKRKAWGCLGLKEIALEHTILDGIQCDAILTFFIVAYLNRLMQGEGVPNLSKIVHHDVGTQSDVGTVKERDDDAKLKKSCKGAVWSTFGQGLQKNVLHVQMKRRGCLEECWLKQIKTRLEQATSIIDVEKGAGNQRRARIEGGEVCLLAEEGGLVVKVHDLNKPLELRTIPFQGGENDTNWDVQNSENGDEIKLATWVADVARDKGRNGCEEDWIAMWKICMDDDVAADVSKCVW